MRGALILGAVLIGGCGPHGAPAPAPGDAENGRLLLRQFGCGSCHEIPGVADAKGREAPPLAGVGQRIYLAGNLPNTPANLAAFIRAPERFAPRTLMPNLGVTEPHARDMAAYLWGLR